VAGADLQELGRKLFALGQVHRNFLVRQTRLLDHLQRFAAVIGQPVIDLDHLHPPFAFTESMPA
jgi:hypothetical protein